MEKPKYRAILPAAIRYDDRLSSSEKLMFCEITAFRNHSGTCWATNEYFAHLYNVSKFTISRWISNLVQCGYITSKIIYGENKKIEKRVIEVAVDLEEDGEEENTPVDENCKEKFNQERKQ